MGRTMRLRIALLAVSALASPLAAERLPVQRHGVAEGLAEETVTALLKDSRGYLWVGSLNGLSRFDGERFRVYGVEDGLPKARICALAEAADGAVWVATSGGLARLGASEPSTRPAFKPAGPAGGKPVEYVFASPDGAVWWGTGGELYEGKRRGRACARPDSQRRRRGAVVRVLRLAPDGSILAGTSRGLFRVRSGAPAAASSTFEGILSRGRPRASRRSRGPSLGIDAGPSRGRSAGLGGGRGARPPAPCSRTDASPFRTARENGASSTRFRGRVSRPGSGFSSAGTGASSSRRRRASWWRTTTASSSSGGETGSGTEFSASSSRTATATSGSARRARVSCAFAPRGSRPSARRTGSSTSRSPTCSGATAAHSTSRRAATRRSRARRAMASVRSGGRARPRPFSAASSGDDPCCATARARGGSPGRAASRATRPPRSARPSRAEARARSAAPKAFRARSPRSSRPPTDRSGPASTTRRTPC